LYQKGLLAPENEVSRGKVAKYSFESLCAASVALELWRKGIDPRLIEQVMVQLGEAHAPLHPVPKSMSVPAIWSFKNALKGVREGKLWLLTIWTFDQPDDTSNALVGIHPTTDGLNEEDKELRAATIIPEQCFETGQLGKRRGLKITIDLYEHLYEVFNEVSNA
ncbi:MAG: hypothetical protein AAF498_11555, partial [Pseudomonadota bacterium]